jgi:starch synthase
LKVLLAHPGTQSSFRLAVELQHQATLGAFHTGIAFCAGGLTDKVLNVLPRYWRRRIANRRIEGLPNQQLHCHPIGELRTLLRSRGSSDTQAIIHRRNEKFQRAIPDRVLASVQAVIGFDTSAWILADRCARYKVPLVLVQTIGHPDAKLNVYEEVKRRYPGWEDGAERRLAEVRAAEETEYEGASLIIVGSSFTQQSLIHHGIPAAKIRINPYGVDCSQFLLGKGGEGRKFRFVFAGAISARKGIPLLLEAWKRLAAQDAELWLVGPASQNTLKYLPRLPGLRYLKAVPHSEMAAVLQQCDVFVFPSYFEGFAKVIPEAMACGLPVLTTTATAGPDLITEGQDGWVIEPGDVERLVEIMSACLANPRAVREMGRCARATAERLTWAEYGRRWMDVLASLAPR